MLQGYLDKMAEEFRRNNEVKREEMCRSAIKKHFDPNQASECIKSGGSKDYEKFVDVAQKNYLEEVGQCPAAMQVLETHIQCNITEKLKLVQLADKVKSKVKVGGFTSRSTARVILRQVLTIATCGTQTQRGYSL